MSESCGFKCIQYMMFFFNLLFFLAGGGLVGVTAWLLVDGASFKQLIASNVEYTYLGVYIVLGVGVALVVISFFGCCGAIKKNKCMLGTFFTLVLLTFIIELAGAVLAFVFLTPIQNEILTTMGSYNETDESNPITQAWDTLQQSIQCCGYTKYTDWVNSSWEATSEGELFPASCCVVKTRDCNTGNPTSDMFYTTACQTRFLTGVYIIGGAGLGVLVIELLGLIFTCCLYRSITEDYYG